MRAKIDFDQGFEMFIQFEIKPSLKIYDQNYEWLPFLFYFENMEDHDYFMESNPKSFVISRLIDGDSVFETWQIFKILNIFEDGNWIEVSFEGCSLLN